MDIRGPCLVTFHNGKECKLYEICTTEKTLAGFTNKRYYFTDEDDANIYRQYLNQVYGIKDIKRILNSNKFPAWEKAEYRTFMCNLDLQTLEDLVKNIHFKTESNFVKYRGNNGQSNNDSE